MWYRQGDVVLLGIKGIPAKAKKSKRSKRGIVLALGEVTGHAHVIKDDADLLITETERFLRVHAETQLVHEEHSTLTLPPGDFRVVIQREYQPESIQSVRD